MIEEKRRVLEIDGLRALAVVIVVIWHASLRVRRFSTNDIEWTKFFPHGEAGVEIFFAISGFVLCFSLMSSAKSGLKLFYLKRFLRVAPLYYAVVLVMFIAIAELGVAPENAPSFGKSTSGLVDSLGLTLLFSHGIVINSPPRLLPPGWSLEVEMQFYIIAPFIFAIFLYLVRISAMMFIVVSLVFWLILNLVAGDFFFFRWTVFHYLLVFLAGIFACYSFSFFNGRTPSRTANADICVLLGLFAVISSSYMRDYSNELFLPQNATVGWIRPIISAVGCFYLVLGAVNSKTLSHVLNSWFVQRIGKSSYSVYLLHVPVLHMTAIAYGKVFGAPSNWQGNLMIGAIMLIVTSVITYSFFKIFEENYNRFIARHVR